MVSLTVITGPPCSGKTTYLREHARAGEIAIDFDAIAQALGSPVTHGHDRAIWEVAVEARNAAIAAAIERHRKGSRVWITDTAPPPRRLRQYEDAGAKIVTLAADRAELHRRATAAGRPARWHDEIDRILAGRRAPPHTKGGQDPPVQERTRW